jgi:hypothetical protein
MKRGFRLPSGRSRLRALAPALVLLGICVFAWGLRYKLSLYAPAQSVTRQMPAAKLLAPDRSAVPAAALDRAVDRSVPLAIPLWFATLVVLTGMKFWSGSEWVLYRGGARTSTGWFHGASAFIRPPPRS